MAGNTAPSITARWTHARNPYLPRQECAHTIQPYTYSPLVNRRNSYGTQVVIDPAASLSLLTSSSSRIRSLATPSRAFAIASLDPSYSYSAFRSIGVRPSRICLSLPRFAFFSPPVLLHAHSLQPLPDGPIYWRIFTFFFYP